MCPKRPAGTSITFQLYMPNPRKAFLMLEDGTVFEGKSFGYEAPADGEVVFNSAMTG